MKQKDPLGPPLLVLLAAALFASLIPMGVGVMIAEAFIYHALGHF